MYNSDTNRQLVEKLSLVKQHAKWPHIHSNTQEGIFMRMFYKVVVCYKNISAFY